MAGGIASILIPYFCPMPIRRKRAVRVAVLDLYAGEPNEGVSSLEELLRDYAAEHDLDLTIDFFDVRREVELPSMEYELFISTGGPGSPLASAGSPWERRYFQWMGELEVYNATAPEGKGKPTLFICHSFQLACRYFGIGKVIRRKSAAFGVFPVHLVGRAASEPVFEGLPPVIYALDNRNYQVISPDAERLSELGAYVLAIEKERPHVPLERAVMAIRFNHYMFGTQFHPEVETGRMLRYLKRPDKREEIIREHGKEKYAAMLELLQDPTKVACTYALVIPNFLHHALRMPRESAPAARVVQTVAC